MECNKEEAIRAKGIAEKKMQNRDFVGARKIALKAQQLFPELENISQMLTVCNVHCSAEIKVPGSEMDWYGILQVDQMTDETSIKKQYRKLALLLHPDKNKFSGAEAAFKLIGEAHRVLTDQAKRSLYDIKRRANVRTAGTRQPAPHMNRNSYPRRQSGVQNNFTNNATSQFPGVSQQQAHTVPTFWTLCPFCGIRYEYYRTIVNRALRCQNCTQTFTAYDINVQGGQPAVNTGYSWSQSANPQPNEVPNQTAHNVGRHNNAGTAAGGTTSSQPFSNKATSDGEMNRRAQTARPTRNSSQKRGRKMVVEESSESCDSGSTTDIEDMEEDSLSQQKVEVTSNRYPRRSTRQKQQVTYNEDGSDDDDDDFVNLPKSKRSRRGVSLEVDNNWSDEAFSEGDAGKTREPRGETSFEDGNEAEQKGGGSSEESLPNGKKEEVNHEKNRKEEIEDSKEKGSSELKLNTEAKAIPSATSGPQSNGSNSATYRVADFSNFGRDRTQEHFAVDQIWAVYDDSEGMPRYYVRIRRICSPGFKLRITWLEPLPNPEDQDQVDWTEEDLPFACGNFKYGRTEVTDDLAIFSHLASWEDGVARGTYKIYPKKGEVWALFKGWNIKWSSNPDLHKKYEYEIVEILSDYGEMTGIEVVYLVKLEGFVSLFQRRTSKEKKPIHIPPKQMLRFSHRIPYFRMMGKEGKGVPEGALELDPASLPSNIQESRPSIIKEMPTTGSAKCATTKMKVEVDKNNILDKESTEKSVHSPRVVNGAHEKYVSDGKNGSLRDIPNTRHSEADAARHQTGKKSKHLDGGQAGSYDTGESISDSPAPPLKDEFEYPEPEFYTFEKDRSKDKFQPGQIWALYSDVDTLPKFYALIRKVQKNEFEVHVTWLEPLPASQGVMKWSNDELPVSCGTFKLARVTEVYSETSMFSHQVQAGPSSKKGRFNIHPRKGEVWAVYKDMSTAWTRSDLKKCEHHMVEILEDCGSKITVLVLEGVDGFNSVLRGTHVSMDIPHDHLLRFSHQIPAFRLTKERGGKLKGCLELDPAAMPPAFFRKPPN